MRLQNRLNVIKADLKEASGAIAAGTVAVAILAGAVSYGRQLIPDFTGRTVNQGIERVVHSKSSNLEDGLACVPKHSHSWSEREEGYYSFKDLNKDYKKAMDVLGDKREDIAKALSRKTDTTFGNDADTIHPIVEGILDWREYRDKRHRGGSARSQRRRAVEHGIDVLSVSALNTLDDKTEAQMDSIEDRYVVCLDTRNMDYKLAAELQRIIQEGSGRIRSYRIR